MRTLITGGAGFIGSHLADKLIAAGDSVTVFDDFSTGNRANIKALLKSNRFKLVKGTVLDKKALAPLVKKSDRIFHLAAAVGVKLVVAKPLQSLITNLDGTRVVLDLAAKQGCLTLIASTSEVYGKNPKLPFSENDDRVYGSVYHERWGYALAKTIDELMGVLYWREKKLPTVMVRFFNTTGPRQSSAYGMVVPTFVRQALANQPLTIHADGLQVRSFSYVDDIVRGITTLIAAPKAYGEVINLGSNEPVTIRELAERIIAKTDSRSKIVYVPYHKAFNKTFEDTPKRIPDIAKAKRLIGYQPQFSLDMILDEAIRFQRQYVAK